jgi:predicted O-methyltransferase YrrM
MFHHIPQAMWARMHELEQLDLRDRTDGTPRMKRLRQIPPEASRFIAILAATALEGECLEVGTNAGYSTLWLALACRVTRRKVITFEISAEKIELARLTFEIAGVAATVELVQGDALNFLPRFSHLFFARDRADCSLFVSIERRTSALT